MMIPLAIPDVSGNEAAYLQECIDSTFVSSVGPFVGRFETMVVKASDAAGAVAVSAGTTGLHLALHTLGVRPGDLVAMPSLTFIASANAIAHCGAMPWLFDVDPNSWTIDVEQLAAVFRRELKPGPDGPVHRPSQMQLAAIMPVHTLGHPADMDPIVALGEEFGVPVVADAAAALGARYRQRPIGATGAAATVFSFNGNKTVTAGGGGAIVSDDEGFLQHARHLSTTARIGVEYDHDEVGFNYRMTNLQAAVGCAQMERLDRFVQRKRHCQAVYRDAVHDLDGVEAFPEAPWAVSACWFSGVLSRRGDRGEAADLRAALRADGIDARPFWKPMHLQRPYASAPVEAQSVTDELWSRIVTLPCSTSITDAELDQVVSAVRRRISQ
jgi:perosamine synthetase